MYVWQSTSPDGTFECGNHVTDMIEWDYFWSHLKNIISNICLLIVGTLIWRHCKCISSWVLRSIQCFLYSIVPLDYRPLIYQLVFQKPQ